MKALNLATLVLTIVAGLDADQQLAIGRSGGLVGQQLLQDRRGELAAASATVGKAGEAHNGCVHCQFSWLRREPAASPAVCALRRAESDKSCVNHKPDCIADANAMRLSAGAR